MTIFPTAPSTARPSRRQLLRQMGAGSGMLGLFGVLAQAGLLVEGAPGAPPASRRNPLAAKQPHFAPKAKRVIHIYLNGGPSHVDTFDPKPLLRKYEGKKLPTGNLS